MWARRDKPVGSRRIAGKRPRLLFSVRMAGATQHPYRQEQHRHEHEFPENVVKQRTGAVNATRSAPEAAPPTSPTAQDVAVYEEPLAVPRNAELRPQRFAVIPEADRAAWGPIARRATGRSDWLSRGAE